MSIFFENAWAQDGGIGGDPIMSFIPLIIIFVVCVYMPSAIRGSLTVPMQGVTLIESPLLAEGIPIVPSPFPVRPVLSHGAAPFAK